MACRLHLAFVVSSPFCYMQDFNRTWRASLLQTRSEILMWNTGCKMAIVEPIFQLLHCENPIGGDLGCWWSARVCKLLLLSYTNIFKRWCHLIRLLDVNWRPLWGSKSGSIPAKSMVSLTSLFPCLPTVPFSGLLSGLERPKGRVSISLKLLTLCGLGRLPIAQTAISLTRVFLWKFGTQGQKYSNEGHWQEEGLTYKSPLTTAGIWCLSCYPKRAA